MLTVNAFVEIVAPENTMQITTQVVFLLFFLVSLEAVQEESSILNKTKEYALWKCTQTCFQLYQGIDIHIIWTLCFVVLTIVLKLLLTKRMHVIGDLLLLVLIKAVFDHFDFYINLLPKYDMAIILFCFAIVMTSFLSVLEQN